MKITSVNIRGFGKFIDKAINFSDGINVVYGNNEAGKSTTHSFIKAMLFGIMKNKNKRKTDIYTKFEPWDKTANYEGTLCFTHEDKDYQIHRIFTESKSVFEIREVRTGSLIADPEKLLNKALCNLTIDSFDNTISIGQMKTAQDGSIAQDLHRFIANLNTSGNMSINTIAAINYLKRQKEDLTLRLKSDATIEYNKQLGSIKLMEKELSSKEYKNLLPEIISKKTSVQKTIDDNNAEIEKLKSEIAASSIDLENNGFITKDDIDSLKRETERIFLEYCPIADTSKIKFKLIANIILIVFGIITIIFNTLVLIVTYPSIASLVKLNNITYQLETITGFVISLPFHPALLIGFLYCVGFILILGNVLLAFSHYQEIKEANDTKDILSDIFKQHIGTEEVNDITMNHFKKHIKEKNALVDSIEKAEARIIVLTKENNELMTSKEKMDDKIKDQQKVQYDVEQKYNELYDLRIESEKMKQDINVNDSISKEIEGIDHAIDTLMELSDKIHVMFGTYLNKSASAYLYGLTNGKYSSLNVDDNLNVTVNYEDKIINLNQVSTGTMDQIYLAMRLATADVIRGNKEALPLLFDDCFVMYDNDRLVSTLKYLKANTESQVIIFTCHTREAGLLGHNNIDFNKIVME